VRIRLLLLGVRLVSLVSVLRRLAAVLGGILAVVVRGKAVFGRSFSVLFRGRTVPAGLGPVIVGGALLRPRLAELADEVLPVTGGVVAVLTAQQPVRRRPASVVSVLRGAVLAIFCLVIAQLRSTVPLLSPLVTLVARLQQGRDVWLSLGGTDLPSFRLAVTLVGFAVAPVRLAVTAVGVAVAFVCVEVSSIRGLVPRVGPRGPLGPFGGRLPPGCGCLVPIVGGSVAQVGLVVTASGRWVRTGGCTFVGDALALLGDAVAVVRDAVALVGDIAASAVVLGLGACLGLSSRFPRHFFGHSASPPLVRLVASATGPPPDLDAPLVVRRLRRSWSADASDSPLRPADSKD